MTDAQTEQALQNLIKGTASADEIELLRQKLSTGQISIGGDVHQSVIILGDDSLGREILLAVHDVSAWWP